MQQQSAQPVDQKLVTVTKEQADRLHQSAKEFQLQFQKDKSQFSHSEESVYYIVSCRFLSQWRDYATAHSLQRYLPEPMNMDILQNGRLKPELKQGEDFQLLSYSLNQRFFSDQPCKIRRRAITVGTQKRVPIYLQQYTYTVLTQQHLRCIDRNAFSTEHMQLRPVQISQENTIGDLVEEIRSLERYSPSKKLRVWKIGQKSLQDVWKHVKREVARCSSYEYKIKFMGKILQNDKLKLNQLQFDPEQFMVIQAVDGMKRWHLMTGTQAKCQGCYAVTQLTVHCGCKKVSYCTQQCKQKDKRFHLRHCQYSIMQQERKLIDMTITESSARGRVGLSNLGNTCFMNSCLQCLSNTIPLTDYFLNSYFQSQINRNNPIGTGGKLARSYAKFIRSMWCQSNNIFSPHNIKSQVSRINQMFSGYAQHDSQQFFSFLVDGLHEDLNRIEKKPIVESVDSNGREDGVVAMESWIAHIKRNQSVIVDLMTGQYRSKVTCPDCSKQSITFDPFITVTLPIPQKVVNSLGFYLIYANMNKKSQRYYFTYQRVKANDWMQSVSKLIDMPVNRFGLYVLSIAQGLHKVGREPITDILHKIESESKNLFLVEYSDEDLQIKQPIQLPVRFAKKFSYDFDNLWFKFPFLFNKHSIKGIDIYVRILKFLYGKGFIYNQDSDDPTPYNEYEKLMLEKRPFKIFLKYNKKIQRTYHRLTYTYEDEQQVDDDVDISDFIQKQPAGDCQIDVRFYSRNSLDYFEFDNLKEFEEKMKKPKPQSSENVTVSIDQCFQHFREVERLEKGNQWYCPKCKEHKQAEKQLSIYKAPKILILHLKRFKQKGVMRKEKNQSKVEFPMELNMTEYLHDTRPMSSYVQEAKKLGVYVEPKEYKPVNASEEPIYELYAVSNHYGGLGGGHYTAYAKNNGKWFQFNDSSVRACSESYITGSGAYILFYKRKE